MDNKVFILGVPLQSVSLDEAVAQVSNWLQGDVTRLVFTPNAEIIALAQDNAALKQALAQADLTVPDGIGVVWAAHLLGQPLKGRVPGIELLDRLLQMAAMDNYSVYLFGGCPGVAAEAKRRLEERYGDLNIVGFHHGYFDAEEEKKVQAEIQALRPDILAVALGAPKQELWLIENVGSLPVKLALGVGGSLDVIAGKVKRAPLLWRRLGLEWLYRIMTDRRRLKRAWQLPRFVVMVLKAKYRKA
ncbi:MAG TPA: WecB/TagA/CpsF family glycosyltransferase [bacterium]|nr:WecB/TagA/CpsF family glycosyltransferase [bacterium]